MDAGLLHDRISRTGHGDANRAPSRSLRTGREWMMDLPRLDGAFLRVVDIEGRHHAIRCQAVTALAEVGDDASETMIVVYGREVIRANHGLDSILDTLAGPPRPHYR